MGRRSRRRSRDEPDLPTGIGSPDVHITVATTLPDQEVSLHHEIELVKAALLYADKVTLASPRAALLAQLAGFTVLGPERVTATADLLSQLPDAAATMALYERLKQKRRLAPSERMQLAELERVFAHVGRKLGEDIESMLEEAGADELALAIEAGVLEIHPRRRAEVRAKQNRSVERFREARPAGFEPATSASGEPSRDAENTAETSQLSLLSDPDGDPED